MADIPIELLHQIEGCAHRIVDILPNACLRCHGKEFAIQHARNLERDVQLIRTTARCKGRCPRKWTIASSLGSGNPSGEVAKEEYEEPYDEKRLRDEPLHAAIELDRFAIMEWKVVDSTEIAAVTRKVIDKSLEERIARQLKEATDHDINWALFGEVGVETFQNQVPSTPQKRVPTYVPESSDEEVGAWA